MKKTPLTPLQKVLIAGPRPRRLLSKQQADAYMDLRDRNVPSALALRLVRRP